MPRRGIALAAAMYLVVLLSGLVLVSLADAGESHRAALRELHHARALSAAEMVVSEVLDGWDMDAVRELAPGASSAIHERETGDGPWPVVGRARVTRLAEELFWIGAYGVAGSGADRAERRLALLVEHRRPARPRAAVVVEQGGTLETGAAFSITTEGGDCDSGADLIAAAPDASLRFGSDSIATARVRSGLSSTLYALVTNPVEGTPTRAVTVPGGSIARLPLNAPPAGESPQVILGEGDLTLTGGSGSGILLVRGTLHMEGDSWFRGLVVAAGGIRLESGVAGVTGTIVVPPVSSALLMAGQVIGSDCATRDAVAALARPVVIRQRGWIELW